MGDTKWAEAQRDEKSQWDGLIESLEDGLARLDDLDEELCHNRDIVLAAVGARGTALQYAGKELQSDRGIVMTAVRQNGEALRYAAEEFRRDREVVLAAAR